MGCNASPPWISTNVGQVEVLTLWGDTVRVLLAASDSDPSLKATFRPHNTSYLSLGDPQSVFEGTASEFAEARAVLEPLHMEFVRAAATTSKGKPRRGTPFRRFHSPALMDYARAETSALTHGFYVFLWNPLKDRSFPEVVARFKTQGSFVSRWSCGTSMSVREGDHAILRRTGSVKKGIIGIGTVVEKSFEEPWSAGDDIGRFVRISWEYLTEDPIIEPGDPECAHSTSVRDHCLKSRQPLVCEVCGLDPTVHFGMEFRNLLEVHHLDPIAESEPGRETDPELECCPLCPTCHRLAHHRMRAGTCRSIQELKRIVRPKLALSG